jgi:hypothetical protein
MNFPSRRRLLQFTALAPFAAMAASAGYAPIPRVGKARFSPTLNAYSFLEQLNANLADPTTGIDLFGVCDFCVEQEIEAVDLTGYFFPGYPKAPSDEYVARIKRYTHDRGITISGTGVKNDFATANPAVRAEGVALTKVWIEVAARLGAPVVRVFAGPQPPHKDWQSASGNVDRTIVDYQQYYDVMGSGGIFTTMISSRGCPYRCSFCNTPRHRYRVMSPTRVCDEIQACIDLGIREIYFVDDTFNITNKRVHDLCDEILRRGQKFRWTVRFRVKGVDRLGRIRESCGVLTSSAGTRSEEAGQKSVRDTP